MGNCFLLLLLPFLYCTSAQHVTFKVEKTGNPGPLPVTFYNSPSSSGDEKELHANQLFVYRLEKQVGHGTRRVLVMELCKKRIMVYNVPYYGENPQWRFQYPTLYRGDSDEAVIDCLVGEMGFPNEFILLRAYHMVYNLDDEHLWSRDDAKEQVVGDRPHAVSLPVHGGLGSTSPKRKTHPGNELELSLQRGNKMLKSGSSKSPNYLEEESEKSASGKSPKPFMKRIIFIEAATNEVSEEPIHFSLYTSRGLGLAERSDNGFDSDLKTEKQLMLWETPGNPKIVVMEIKERNAVIMVYSPVHLGERDSKLRLDELKLHVNERVIDLGAGRTQLIRWPHEDDLLMEYQMVYGNKKPGTWAQQVTIKVEENDDSHHPGPWPVTFYNSPTSSGDEKELRANQLFVYPLAGQFGHGTRHVLVMKLCGKRIMVYNVPYYGENPHWRFKYPKLYPGDRDEAVVDCVGQSVMGFPNEFILLRAYHMVYNLGKKHLWSNDEAKEQVVGHRPLAVSVKKKPLHRMTIFIEAATNEMSREPIQFFLYTSRGLGLAERSINGSDLKTEKQVMFIEVPGNPKIVVMEIKERNAVIMVYSRVHLGEGDSRLWLDGHKLHVNEHVIDLVAAGLKPIRWPHEDDLLLEYRMVYGNKQPDPK